MTLITGKIIDIFIENGMKVGKVSVSGVYLRVPLIFVPESQVGDWILIEAGVGIAQVKNNSKENENVSCNSW